jgi:preprotein translocase subunit YajC
VEYLPIVALAVLFWVFILRPQRRRSSQQRALWSTLEVGDDVVTAAGLRGTVRGVEDVWVQLEIAPGTVVEVDRRAIARRVPEASASDDPR